MNKRILLKENLVYLLGNAGIAIIGFILSLLYSRMFEPKDFGVYSLVYSAISLSLSVLTGWMPIAITRYYSEYKNSDKENVFIGSFLQTHLIISIAFIVIANSIVYIIPLSSLARNLLFLFSLSFFVTQSIFLIGCILNAQKQVKQYNYNNLISHSIKIITILILFYGFHYTNVTLIVIGILAGDTFIYIYMLYKSNFIKYYNFSLMDFTLVHQMFRFGLPIIGVSVLSWILEYSDQYIIQYFYSKTEVGIYSYAHSITLNLFSLLTQFVLLGAIPNIVNCWTEGNKEEASQLVTWYLKIYYIVLVPAVFGIAGVAKLFFSLFADIQYFDGYHSFIWLSASMALLGIYNFICKIWELIKKVKMEFYVSCVISLLIIVANVIFVPQFGYNAASVVSFAARTVQIVLSIFLIKRDFKFTINYKEICKTLFSGLVMFMVIILVNICIVNNSIIKLLIDIILGGIVYILLIFALNIVDKNYAKSVIKNK